MVVWVRDLLLSYTQGVWVGGQLAEEVRVASGVPLGAFGSTVFVAQVRKGYLEEHRVD